jgi:hypothetical protein
MELEERLKKQAKDLNTFLKTQTEAVKGYQGEVMQQIDKIEDKSIKAKLGSMLGEAMKGNLKNAQNLSKHIQNEFINKQKKSTDAN